MHGLVPRLEHIHVKEVLGTNFVCPLRTVCCTTREKTAKLFAIVSHTEQHLVASALL